MKKLVKHFKAAYRDPAKSHDRPVEEVPDPKFIVVNQPNPPIPYPPNPYPYPYPVPAPAPAPAPAPVPSPYPDNKGVLHNNSIQKDNTEDVGTFSGFGSWMASFEPDPGAQGVVEVPGPVPSQPLVLTKMLSLAEGHDQFSLIRLTLNDVKTRVAEKQNFKHVVVINGPWFMTLAQVNQLLEKHGYRPMLSAKHGQSAARNWDGEKALPAELQIPVIDGPSRYDAPPGEGPLMSRNEQFGTFLDNLRRLRVRCHEGKVLATSYPAELEINFNRTLRLPEDGKVHDQPIRLGKIGVNNIAGISKKLEASGSQSLVDMARKGGVFFPLYQREAMFLSFKARQDAFAVRVFVGGVNAVSGLPWNSHPGYKKASQDYLSVPPQQFLDGVCVGKDVVKQFIAMPLGSGYSVEKQVTGKETVGGMQLEITPGNRWEVYISASDHLPQPGPYYPEPDQRAGTLGVDMVVLGDRRDLLLPGGKRGDTDLEKLVDKTKFPVYMRQLYQSQVEPSYPTYMANQIQFQRGMHLQMTAVYMLELNLRYTNQNYGEERTETVNWAPWWTLDRCFTEHEKLDSDHKAKTTSRPLRELELYFQGSPLSPASLSLQEQGVTHGAFIEVRQRQPYGHGYGHQYPDGKPNPYNNYPYPLPVQGSPQQYQYQQQDGPSYPSYQSPPAHYCPPQQQQQQQSHYPSPQTSYGSPVPGYSSPHQSYVSAPSSAASPSSPQPYAGQMPIPSFSPPSLSAPLPDSAPPPRMSAPPPMAQGSVHSPQPGFSPPRQPTAASPPPSSPGGSSYYPSQQSYSGVYEPSRPSASSSSPPVMSGPARISAPPSSPPPRYDSHTGSYPQQGATPMPHSAGYSSAIPQPLPVKPQPKPQDQTGWAMGLAAGSKIHQAILADPFSPLAWRKDRTTMLSVQILNSVAFESLTGMLAPSTPITPEMYIKQGLPFLKSYEEGITTDGSEYLAGIKGVGDVDAEGGGVKLGSNMSGGVKIGCTACGKMLCDSILRPCNHAFCSNCIKQSMTYPSGPGTFTTICRMCNTKATKLIGFSAPMALPGEDVVDLSEAKVITVQPFQGGSEFHSVHELPAGDDFPDGGPIQYPPYPYHEMQA